MIIFERKSRARRSSVSRREFKVRLDLRGTLKATGGASCGE